MAKHNEIGVKGENLATQFLEKKGYTILERNWKRQYAEIDIIATDQHYIIFIEVKTRSSEIWGAPEDAISKYKISQIVKGASIYLEENDTEDLEPRFDIISVILKENNAEIRHVDDAFYPTLD